MNLIGVLILAHQSSLDINRDGMYKTDMKWVFEAIQQWFHCKLFCNDGVPASSYHMLPPFCGFETAKNHAQVEKKILVLNAGNFRE